MNFNKLSKEKIKISIDRLTRFKQTEEKYLRVFSDIITSCLIEPKLKKNEILNMPYDEIRDIAVEIFNSSLPKTSNSTLINNYLEDYENKTFFNSTNTRLLLKNTLDYESALSIIDFDEKNLVWISNIKQQTNILNERKQKKFLYPIEKVIIAEGITEEILLPECSKICGFDFNENGVKILSAGGKNQVVKLYYKLREELKLPIFVLLDKDAQKNEEIINSRLRQGDRVYLLNSGEFEDLLPKNLILKTINSEFKNFVSLKLSDLNGEHSTVKLLEEIFKEKCLHEFKKADFAQNIKQQISSEKDISDELKTIIDEIKTF